MVEMTDSSLLVERKTTYSAALKNQTVKEKDSSRPYLNGDVSYSKRKESSSSVNSYDSQLNNLLEAADRIKDGKNIQPKEKRRVHFNMDKNQEFSYSYTQHNSESSDDEGGILSSNINLVGYDYMNGHDDDSADDDEEEDDDDDDDDDDCDYDTETSEEGSNHGLGKYGYLVDKSSEQNKDINGNIGANGVSLNGIGYNHQEIITTKTYDEKQAHEKESKILQFETSLLQRKNSVQRKLSDLNENLRKTREEANREMEQLKTELEARRHEYMTEIQDINCSREEQRRKFEEELEEFRNEKQLEERRQRYQEHEALITKKEAELEERKRQAIEQDREVRECEEYLNRRHTACNNKEKDLVELQHDLDTLSQELEAKRERLLNKSKTLDQRTAEADEKLTFLPPLIDQRRASRSGSGSRVSTLSRGTDLRIEELKHQNKQLLEELFSLRKALESQNEREEETQRTMEVLASDNKRLQQKVKNLESQLELARKGAELASETPALSVDEILRKTTADIRSSRLSRGRLTPSALGSIAGSHARLSREPSKESIHSKGSGSSDASEGSKGSGSKNMKDSSKSSKDSSKGTSKGTRSSSKGTRSSKDTSKKTKSSGGEKDTSNGTNKSGGEKVTSALCVVM